MFQVIILICKLDFSWTTSPWLVLSLSRALTGLVFVCSAMMSPLCIQTAFSYKDTSQTVLAPTLRVSTIGELSTEKRNVPELKAPL